MSKPKFQKLGQKAEDNAVLMAQSFAKEEGAVGKKVGGLPVLRVSIDMLFPNPKQVRRTFDHPDTVAHIEALEQQIRVDGLLQLISVVPRARGGYMIIEGECRYRALKRIAENPLPSDKIDTKEIIVYLRFSSVAAEEDAGVILEGIQANQTRKSISDAELALSINSLIDSGCSPETVKLKLGMSKQRLSKLRKIGRLPEDVLLSFAPYKVGEKALVACVDKLEKDGQDDFGKVVVASLSAIVSGVSPSRAVNTVIFGDVDREKVADRPPVKGKEAVSTQAPVKSIGLLAEFSENVSVDEADDSTFTLNIKGLDRATTDKVLKKLGLKGL